MATQIKNKPTSFSKRKPNDLHDFLKISHTLSLVERTKGFMQFIEDLQTKHQYTYKRRVLTPADRTVEIWDEYENKSRSMLMFASNNYLGLANHPHVKKKVIEAINEYGVGIGGPPLLNGYSKLMEELEERLARFKHQEAAMIFPTGYSANLGLLGGLTNENDVIVFDHYSHASFYDGLRFTHAKTLIFEHNDMEELEDRLKEASVNLKGNLYVGVEGVYSMDGDLAPLDKIIPLLKKHNAILLLDDAHGTGVMGKTGSGTAEHFGLSDQVDVSMGTFSKTFAVTGGFVAASKEVINYLRFFARSYMFSASLPPMTLAAVLAGLDVIENEPEIKKQLLEVRDYAIEKLGKFGFYRKPDAAILALKIPDNMDIRKANYEIHQKGIFLNAIEYPAVAEHEERFRISLMARHTKEDIDQLTTVLEKVFANKSNYHE